MAAKPVLLTVDDDAASFRVVRAESGPQALDILDGHRGDVAVASAPGDTRFSVRLPIA